MKSEVVLPLILLTKLFLTTPASIWQTKKTTCCVEDLLMSWLEDECFSLSLTCPALKMHPPEAT